MATAANRSRLRPNKKNINPTPNMAAMKSRVRPEPLTFRVPATAYPISEPPPIDAII